MEKLWNGRFSSETDKLADIFNSSLPVDKKCIDRILRRA